MKQSNDGSTGDTLARKRTLIRSLIEQSRREEDAGGEEPTPSPLALFRLVGSEAEELGQPNESQMAEIIPFPRSPSN